MDAELISPTLTDSSKSAWMVTRGILTVPVRPSLLQACDPPQSHTVIDMISLINFILAYSEAQGGFPSIFIGMLGKDEDCDKMRVTRETVSCYIRFVA